MKYPHGRAVAFWPLRDLYCPCLRLIKIKRSPHVPSLLEEALWNNQNLCFSMNVLYRGGTWLVCHPSQFFYSMGTCSAGCFMRVELIAHWTAWAGGGKGTRWGVQRRLTVSVLWVGVSSPFRGRMPIPKAMWSSVPLLWVFKKPCNASFSLHAKVKLSHGTSPIKCSLGSFCDPGHTRHFER